jgi:hypothetical protein
MVKAFLVLITLSLSGCAGLLVRQQDLDAWVGVPVEALDTHSLFLTVPMIRTKTESGLEIRNYANGKNISSCSGFGNAAASGGWVQASAFSNCTSGWQGCNNIFYIRNGKVLEYTPMTCPDSSDHELRERSGFVVLA